MGVLGVITLDAGRAKTFLLGLGLGYFIFGLTFTYHIHTHYYYHLQLLPVIALSLGALFATGARRLSNLQRPRLVFQSKRWISILTQAFVVVLFCLLFLVSWRAIGDLEKRPESVAMAQEADRGRLIGKILNHTTEVISLAPSYGKILQYYGEIGAYGWPSRADFRGQREIGHPMAGEDDAKLLWERNFQGKVIRYFVVTDLDEFTHQQSLVEFLRRYPSCRGAGYLIFDLRSAADASPHCDGGG
jgi:hypothetical protein